MFAFPATSSQLEFIVIIITIKEETFKMNILRVASPGREYAACRRKINSITAGYRIFLVARRDEFLLENESKRYISLRKRWEENVGAGGTVARRLRLQPSIVCVCVCVARG